MATKTPESGITQRFAKASSTILSLLSGEAFYHNTPVKELLSGRL